MTIPQVARQTAVFPISDIPLFQKKVLHWAQTFDVFCHLNSNNQKEQTTYNRYNSLMAIGCESDLLAFSSQGAFEGLKAFYEEQKDWLFGFLAYDLKNDTENLQSHNFDGIKMPVLHFFKPTYLFEFQENTVTIGSKGLQPDLIFSIVANTEIEQFPVLKKPKLKARISREEYINTIDQIRHHIQMGDIYEMNFCQEFYSENIQIHPLALFEKLNEKTQTPFACFYKLKDRYLICASPERFLQKRGQQLISQPIKGTAARGETKEADTLLKETLKNSQKNRSENVMIVDLVRNDLARSCKAGTVKPKELFGIYGFENVWQMISTIVGELREDTHFIDAIKLSFPMGSMTGAPKIRSMQLIEKYEKTKRGLYSGAVGYITPDGDFDFNVVIRSLLYNAEAGYLSFQVGGAIVYDSDPAEEYEECLIKGKNILELLT